MPLVAALAFGSLFTQTGCDDPVFSTSDQPPSGGFFPGLSGGVAVSTPVGDVEVPRSTAGVLPAECAVNADLELSGGAINGAVGLVTYVWLDEEHAQLLTEMELTSSPKTSEFEERVRLLGNADQAEAVDAYVSKVEGTLTSWPTFWATRVQAPMAEPHLLQLTLRADALWLTQIAGELVFVDALGNVSPFDMPPGAALQRVAGVFFASHREADDQCQSPFARRELVVTNLDMVEHWALGTDAVLAYVESEMALFNGFAASVRACVYPLSFDVWGATAACTPNSESLLWPGYAANLASLSQAYYPNMRNLAHVSDLVAADLRRWRDEPLVAELVLDTPDTSVPVDAGLTPPDGGVWVWDAAACGDGGGEEGCPTVFPNDAATVAADAAPKDAGTANQTTDTSTSDASGASQ